MAKIRINAGKYRQIITFQQRTGTKNEYGELIDNDTNWENVLTTRSAIYPVSGKEVLTAEFVNSELTHRIHIRFPGRNVSINSHMRIKYGTRIFHIISPPINFQELDRELQLLCKEVII